MSNGFLRGCESIEIHVFRLREARIPSHISLSKLLSVQVLQVIELPWEALANLGNGVHGNSLTDVGEIGG